MPKRIEYFIQAIKEKGKKAAAYEYDKIKDELEDFEGFIDYCDKKAEENE